MNCSTKVNEIATEADDAHKILLGAIDMQTAFNEITAMVENGDGSYLESSSRWLDERSIPENLFAKYIPASIVEKIKDESISERILRPSLAEQNVSQNLDFLY